MRILSLLLLRLSLGSLFFYAGLTKLFDPSWSSVGYLTHAKTFSGFYAWLASPQLLPFIDFVNEWALTLVGLSLLLGLFVRLGSYGGAMLMLLYYFPVLDGVYPNTHSLIVDEHIVYAFAFLLLASLRAGRVFGLETWCEKLPLCSRFPRLRALLG